MSQFKVGDKVRSVAGAFGGSMHIEDRKWVGRVVEISSEGFYADWEAFWCPNEDTCESVLLFDEEIELVESGDENV